MNNDTKTSEKRNSCSSIIETPKLRNAILFFIDKIPGKLNRASLCKHLYYGDGHYYQKYHKKITENEYLHVEGMPIPRSFNELINCMVKEKELEIIPDIVTEITESEPITVLKGLTFHALKKPDLDVFTREEKKVLNSVASLLNGQLSLETRYFPNLYQTYVQTGLFETIPFYDLPDGNRPHLSWKAWADKIFRLMME